MKSGALQGVMMSEKFYRNYNGIIVQGTFKPTPECPSLKDLDNSMKKIDEDFKAVKWKFDPDMLEKYKSM